MPKINYKNAVEENVRKEFDLFFAEEMAKPKEEIFNDHRMILFYSELNEYLSSIRNGLDKDHYRCLYEEGESVIASLYDFYGSVNDTSIDTWDDITDLVHDYNETYHHRILTQIEAE